MDTEQNEKKIIHFEDGFGRKLIFDISEEACKPFGLYTGQHLSTPDKQIIKILGVKKFEGRFHLWFHILNEPIVFYFNQRTKKEIEKAGYKLVQDA